MGSGKGWPGRGVCVAGILRGNSGSGAPLNHPKKVEILVKLMSIMRSGAAHTSCELGVSMAGKKSCVCARGDSSEAGRRGRGALGGGWDRDTKAPHAGVALSSHDWKGLERQSSQTPALGSSSKRSTHPNPEAWHEPSLGNAELSLF